MAKFKPGQKVAFKPLTPEVYPMIDPEDGEVVVIHSYNDIHDSYILVGYEFDLFGTQQGFAERHLQPLIEDETTDHSVTFISSPDSRKLAEKARDYNPMEVPEHLTQEV